MVMLFSLSLTSCKRNNQGNNEENEDNGSNNVDDVRIDLPVETITIKDKFIDIIIV